MTIVYGIVAEQDEPAVPSLLVDEADFAHGIYKVYGAVADTFCIVDKDSNIVVG
jgi:hypothetical protein